MENVPSVLKACGALLDSSYGRVVHGSVEVSSYRCSLYVCNTLISMYTRFGNVDIGWRLFDMMSERNTVKRNTLVKCYASQGKWEEAFKFFYRMSLSGVEATVVTWNTIAEGFLQTGNPHSLVTTKVNRIHKTKKLEFQIHLISKVI